MLGPYLNILEIAQSAAASCKAFMHVHAHMHALTKVISLSEEVYKALKKRKGKRESFSEIVIRITRDKHLGSILKAAGSWVGKDANDIARGIMQEREAATGRAQEF